FVLGFAAALIWEIKSSAAGLSVRCLSVTIATGRGCSPRSMGNALMEGYRLTRSGGKALKESPLSNNAARISSESVVTLARGGASPCDRKAEATHSLSGI